MTDEQKIDEETLEAYKKLLEQQELRRQAKKKPLPPELEATKAAALRAIGPLRPADNSTKAEKNFLLSGQRTEASERLPPNYLIYFLLVDLLGFEDLGQWEKVAWSIPVDYEGRAFLIEHRKFGVGVFAHDAAAENEQAKRIVTLIQKGVKEAEPYFEWLADEAVKNSKLNVSNNSRYLFERYEYFRDSYRKIDAEATARADEREVKKLRNATLVTFPAYRLQENARWMALAAIEAFFSWTEHIFIHIAILSGKVTSGMEVAELAESDWRKKFKYALDVSDTPTKVLFDQLVDIRRQLRNFLAHGSFGKRGEAFQFHSSAGAVPVLLPHKAGKGRFALGYGLAFEDEEALKVIEQFIVHLWSGTREPAKLYIQEAELPLILTMVSDGTYATAMKSVKDMRELVDHLSYRIDRAANMDW